MRLKLFLVLLLFSIADFSLSQEKKILTIDDAVAQALNNNTQLKYQQYELKKAEGLLTKSGILPNPAASFFREDLSYNNENYYEWTASGSMPLNFIWERWSAVRSASAFYEAEKVRYEQSKFNLIRDVKSAFIRVHFYNEINGAWKKALTIIAEAKETAQARETEGEISGYDQQRILLEYLLYEKNESEAIINYHNSLNDFFLLIHPTNPTQEIKTSFDYSPKEISETIPALLKIAKQNRFDYQAAQLQLESKSSTLANEQLKIIPDIAFNLGYKKQSDDLKGLVYGINIAIPLFSRNQGNIEIAEAELNQESVLVEFLSRKIERDVDGAYKKFKEYEERLISLRQYELFDSEEIISTAKFSYDEGEMSLIELIDAIRAYTDSFLLKNELLLNYYINLFELEKAIGKELNK